MSDYVRDKRSPWPKNENTSKVMSANKAKNTKPELKLRHALWSNGIKGYRIHYKKVPGNPDICFVGKRIAIFVNGCFWHHCPECQHDYPKNNRQFWIDKLNRNKLRDIRKIEELEIIGWKAIVIWECQIQSDINLCVDLIRLNVELSIG